MQRTGFEFHPLPFNGEEEFRRQFFHIQQHDFVRSAQAFHERVLGSRAPVATQAELSELDGRVARKILLSHIPGAVLMPINGALHLIFDAMWEYPNALYGGLTRNALDVLFFVNSVVAFFLMVVGFRRLLRIDAAIASLIAVTLVYFVVILSGPEHEQWRYRVPLIPIAAILVGCSVLRQEAQRSRSASVTPVPQCTRDEG